MWKLALAIPLSMSLAVSCSKTKQLGFSAMTSVGASASFSGIQGISFTDAGKPVVLWNLASGISDANSVSYEVYVQFWTTVPNDIQNKIDSQSSTSNATASASNSLSSLPKGAYLLNASGDYEPALKGVLLANVKGARSYTLDDTLKAGRVYAFQVRSVTSDGQRDSNSQIIFYNPNGSFSFTGLLTTGVKLANDSSKITLSWAAATGASNTVSYVVFSDSTFSTAIYQTSALSYDFLNPTQGKAYTFSVRAYDGTNPDKNQQFVIVNIPDSADHTPPVFAGLVTAATVSDTKIQLSWAASPSSDLSRYYIYSADNSTVPIASTTGLTYTVTGLTPVTTYSYLVRARDTSGNEDTNNVTQTATTLAYNVPNFGGITSVSHPSGVYGLSELTLGWSQADSTAVGYKIYQTNSSGSEDFTLPVLTVSSANPTTASITSGSTTVTMSTTYCASVGAAVTGTGIPASTTVTAVNSSSNTVTISNAATSTSTATTINFGLSTSCNLFGLSQNTPYYYVVRAYNSGGYSELNTVEKTNSTLAPVAPTFAGITSAVPGAGSLAFTQATLTWPSPTSNGVWDGFVVQYEAGTCGAGFSVSPTEISLQPDTLRTTTLSGLTAQTNYRVRVRTLYSANANNVRDINSACADIYTSPSPPTFTGITGLTLAAGVSGFTQATASWTAATGSFTTYKVEWSTASNFTGATTLTSTNAAALGASATNSYLITGLPANTLIYVRVSAVFTYNAVTLTSPTTVPSLSILTTPVKPTGEAVSTITIPSPTSLIVNWTAPTNATSALYGGYKVWYSCDLTGAASTSLAATNLLTHISALNGQSPDYDVRITDTTTLSRTFTGLTSNQPCCFQVRAYYDDGTYSLASTSNTAYQCATPALVAPTFAGISSVYKNNTSSGFSQLEVTWPQVSLSDAGLFSYYEVDWATSANGHTWNPATTIQITDRTVTSTTIPSLTVNTTYFVRVRAVNNSGTPSVSNGSTVVMSATTTPKAPTGDGLTAMVPANQTALTLTYTAPSATPNNGGLYNNVFLFVYQGTQTQLNTYQATFGQATSGNATTINIASGNITASTTTQAVTLGTAPTAGALIQVPMAQVTAGASNTFTINGLTTNQQVCVTAMAVYWINGQTSGATSRFLPSATQSTQCATPSATAPTFAGVTSVTGLNTGVDFTQMIVSWGSITGTCTGIDVSVSTTQASADFTTSFSTYKNLSCNATSVTVNGLTPFATYYIQVRAKNVVGSNTYAAGQGVELSKVAAPPIPTGDAATSATFTDVLKAVDTAAVAWTLPTNASTTWNYIYVFKATGGNAATDVVTAATTKSDNSGPTGTPLTIISQALPASSTAISYNDSAYTDGIYACYLIRAVYYDSINHYYQSSANTTTKCGTSTFSTPSFAGVASATNNGTWSDGTAQVKLTFSGSPSGNVEEFYVYYSNSATIGTFDFTNAPWQIVDNTTTNSSNPSIGTSCSPTCAPTYILVGGLGRTFSGAGSFVVRYKNYAGLTTDTNTSVASYTIPTSQANFVYVSPSVSRLGYGYYIGAYEASLASGSYGADTVLNTEANLAMCNYNFHVGHTPVDSTNCGTKASTAKVIHKKSATPTTATWHQAWMACRNSSEIGALGATGATSSSGGVMMRLATELEWRRASHWDSSNYTNQNTVYSGGTGNCNTASGALGNTGAGSSCVSNVGAFDMAGNAREWVDQRMTAYSISGNTETRFSYGPTIGRIVGNGIDTQSSAPNTPVTRRYHQIVPGANDLALILGSDYATSGYTYQKQLDAETETWQDPTVSTTTAVPTRGFRCVAFPNFTQTPTMAQLAQTSEPTYTSSDIPGVTYANWKIPNNFYVKDIKPETVTMGHPAFPSVVGLSVWNFNDASSTGTTKDIGQRADVTLSAGTLTNAAGILGTGSYANTVAGASSITTSDMRLSSVNAFTIGGWFHMADWTTAGNAGLLSWLDSTNLGFEILTLNTNGLCTPGSAASGPCICAVGNNNAGMSGKEICTATASMSAGWHHIVWSHAQGTSDVLYVDGVAKNSTTIASANISAPTNNSLTFGNRGAGINQYFSGRLGAIFMAPSTYTASQVQAVYNWNVANGYFTSPLNNTITLSWQPWTKKSCVVSGGVNTCSTSADTGFNYYIYRYIEPTTIDNRTSTPWVIGAAGGNPYTSTIPMDPLATDNSGNLICTGSTTSCRLVATISGSSCNSGATSACTFTDSATAGTGFSATMVYNYAMVVGDAEGNYRVPRVQRYRTPYLTGDYSLNATATFRTEQRWRRASAFMVDEGYQNSGALQSNPQVMVHVPMDQSGLDHDFFIYKYWASVSGSVANGMGSYPLQSNAGAWVNNAASCYDTLRRTGSFGGNSGPCGNGTALNTTAAILSSKYNITGKVAMDQGAAWQACANTGVVDGSGNTYYLKMPTPRESYKARDMGDVAEVGTIAQSVVGSLVGLTSYSVLNETGIYCAGNRALCQSRYGLAFDNSNSAWNTEQFYWDKTNTVGNDNGVDALWLARNFATGATTMWDNLAQGGVTTGSVITWSGWYPYSPVYSTVALYGYTERPNYGASTYRTFSIANSTTDAVNIGVQRCEFGH